MKNTIGGLLRRLYWFLNKRKYNLKIKKKSNISLNCKFEGHNSIGINCILNSNCIGEGTYIGKNCNIVFTNIGRYCSIGDNVQVLVGNHPSSGFISTHPCFYSTKCQAGFTFVSENKFEEIIKINDYSVNIGSDVWIGTDVSIMGNITIGNGVIIGAKALVTKDCEAYGIYAGIPAKKIGERFSEYEIQYLSKCKWWEQPFENIKEKADCFTDMEHFKKEFNR